MNIFDFIVDVIGMPLTTNFFPILYVISGVLLLVLLDGILTFIISGITSLTTRGFK